MRCIRPTRLRFSEITRHEPELDCACLFAVLKSLTSFQWDLANPDTIQEFADFIRATEEVVGLPLPWRLDSDVNLLYRLLSYFEPIKEILGF